MSVEDLCKRYCITKEQGELLKTKLDTNRQDAKEADILKIVTQIVMLTQNLTKLGFSPDLKGCEDLVSCIPDSTRSLYSVSIIDAAIEYLTNR